jgi:hypothetical protein
MATARVTKGAVTREGAAFAQEQNWQVTISLNYRDS